MQKHNHHPVITIHPSARIFIGEIRRENTDSDMGEEVWLVMKPKPSLLKRVSLWLDKLGRAV